MKNSNLKKKVQEEAFAFAHENGRRSIPFKDGKKFSKPDPDLYWGLSEGYIAGALPRELKIAKMKKSSLVEAELATLAAKVFEVIEGDLRERSGIGHEWNAIEEDIRKELRDENVANVLAVLKEFLK